MSSRTIPQNQPLRCLPRHTESLCLAIRALNVSFWKPTLRARPARAKRIVVHPALDAATSAMPPRGLSKLASTTFSNRNLRRRRNHGFRHQHGADRVRCQLAFSDFTRFLQAANGIIDSCLACNRCQMQNRQITPRTKFPQRIPQPYECGWYSH